MLHELGRAVRAAIAESPEVSDTLGRIHQEGYSLHLSIDCRRHAAGSPSPLVQVRAATPSPSRRRISPDPAFKIDGTDLSFLRSIGIDPTRKLRRRRSG